MAAAGHWPPPLAPAAARLNQSRTAADLRRIYFGAKRWPPSSRMQEPLSIGFSTIATASLAYSSGRPMRLGNAASLVSVWAGVELATALAWDAARGASSDNEARLAAAAAASLALTNYGEAAQKSIQIFGGIGFTWEHDAHLYLRRAAALSAVVAAVGNADDDVYATASHGIRRRYAVDLPPQAEAHRAEARAFLARYLQTPAHARRALLAESGYGDPLVR
jgi:Acyl-CoA dehydrogenase, C-terminal domain